jgi:peptide/nickel transport system substrate-binding protein
MQRRALLASSVALAVSAPRRGHAAGTSVLKVAPEQDLKILDPYWTTAVATANHALMVYDTLYGVDDHNVPRPQMIDSHTLSEDRLVYRFKLRDGLRFHDGNPVTSRDVLASLRRWGARAAEGQMIMARLDHLDREDDQRFSIHLKRPFDLMLQSFAGAGILGLHILREKEAETDPFQQIKTVIGSGPFIFEADKWVPGTRALYRRNPAYVPRADPPLGFSGGKSPRVDVVDSTFIPDQATVVGALSTGEIDIAEAIGYDQVPALAGAPGVRLQVLDPMGFEAYLRPNALHPPFDHPKARQALLYLVDQHDYLAAMIGNPVYERVCLSPLMCGSPLPVPAGLGVQRDLDTARRLMTEAGYDGRPIVVMSPADLPISAAASTLTADLLQRIGCKVDLQVMDFATLSVRRASKADPAVSPAGWHIYHTFRPFLAGFSPVTNNAMATSCGPNGYYGWPCDETMEQLRLRFAEIAAPAEIKAATEALMQRFFEVVPYVVLGEFTRPTGARDTISGLLTAPLLPLWNVAKT